MQSIIAPSILSADFANLADECKAIVSQGADWLHIDIMDNHFVPNLTFGPPVVQCLRKNVASSVGFFDCHLMVSDPESLVDGLIKARSDQITFHIESFNMDEKTGTRLVSGNYDYTAALALCAKIKDHNVRCGIAVSPETPIQHIYPIIQHFDMVLVMTVVPGFGGQSFMNSCLSKVSAVRKKYPTMDIEVDGGLDPITTVDAAKAGANVIVAGSAIFNSQDRKVAIQTIRQAIDDNCDPGHH